MIQGTGKSSMKKKVGICAKDPLLNANCWSLNKKNVKILLKGHFNRTINKFKMEITNTMCNSGINPIQKNLLFMSYIKLLKRKLITVSGLFPKIRRTHSVWSASAAKIWLLY